MKGGKYCVPDEDLPAFFDHYEHAMVTGAALHLTEKPTNPSKMRVDLDFRFPLEAGMGGASTSDQAATELRRVYTPEHVRRIARHYSEVLHRYLDLGDDAQDVLTCYVMEKPGPTENRGKLKDGIHMVWPRVVVSHQFMHLVRKHLLDDASTVFSGLPVCNTFEDIIDQAIIDKNNWQMYGSRKPDAAAYRVTAIMQYDAVAGDMVALPAPTAMDEIKFVRLLSMRDPDATEVAIRPEYVEQVDEYIRHVLPTMDERRKGKLHGQIFAASKNLTKNYVSEDELIMARLLVTECLRTERAESYEDWIKTGWTLRNIDYRLLDTWVEFSRLSSKYIEGECQKLWNGMRMDTLGMGTLRWWAKEDNPVKYSEIMETNVINLVDVCIGSDGAHFDVARVVHAMYKDKYRFTSRDVWYMFRDDKHKWVRTREGLQLRMVLSNNICTKFLERAIYWTQEATRYTDVQAELCTDKARKLNKIALQLKNSGFKDSVMKECKALFTDERFEEVLDSHTHLVGFENGVYDLRMHEFREGLPDDFVSFSTGRHFVEYQPDSVEAREIEGYMRQVFTNESVRKYMMDWLACVIDGGVRQEKFYIFTGSGSNSKSMCLNLIQKAIGDYYCILPIALLTQKRTASNSAQAELERTKGRRLAVMQEPGESERLNIGLMKELTGGDRILCRGLFKEPIEFRPQFKMTMTCNELPEVPSDDGGTWRRLRVVDYTSRFTDNPDPNKPNEFPLDPDLLEKFDRWADMFVSMMLHHHKTIDPKTVHEPTEVLVATNRYRQNNDVIGQFISEQYVADANTTDRVTINKAYAAFRAWAQDVMQKGKKVPDRNQLRTYMEGKFGPYPSAGRGWRGIRVLRQASEDSDSEADETAE